MQSSAEPPRSLDEREDLDLKRYFEVIRKRKWIVLAVIAAGITLAVLYTSRQPRIYQATAKVVIDPSPPQVFGSQVQEVIQLGAGSYWSNQEYYNTQVDILTNFPLARATVEKRYGEGFFYQELVPDK